MAATAWPTSTVWCRCWRARACPASHRSARRWCSTSSPSSPWDCPSRTRRKHTMTELVHLEVADQVATITLDSERNRNALSKQLVTELAAHLMTADADADAKAILIRSAGTVFCSGADMSEAVSVGMAEGAKAIVA